MRERGRKAVVFDTELSPAQIKNIEDDLGGDVTVIDRSMLILDIFALHAVTDEGKIQVELAQLQYSSPRLVGRGDGDVASGRRNSVARTGRNEARDRPQTRTCAHGCVAPRAGPNCA